MRYIRNCCWIICLTFFSFTALLGELSDVPVVYKGRFHPLDAYARLWLSDFYHHEEIKPRHREAFHSVNGSALDLLWKMHFLGADSWNNAPLFWIQDEVIKRHLELESDENYFSYQRLAQAIYKNRETNLAFIKPLLIHFFVKGVQDQVSRSRNKKQELISLSPGLWVLLQSGDLVVGSAPSRPPWHYLEPGMVLLQKDEQNIDFRKHKNIDQSSLSLLIGLAQYEQIKDSSPYEEQILVNEIEALKTKKLSPQAIFQILENQYPLAQRLTQADSLLRVLPGKQGRGDWLPLRALKIKTYDPLTDQLVLVRNFTVYSDEIFANLQKAYINLEHSFKQNGPAADQESLSQQLAQNLIAGYTSIEGQVYLEAAEKSVDYPSLMQLRAEVFYYRYPLVVVTFLMYGLAIVLLCLSYLVSARTWGIMSVFALFMAFLLHTIVLTLRCYILGRPPVSNMYETVIYVPWIAMLLGILLSIVLRNRIILIASALASFLLLMLLWITNTSNDLANVQAVLDSQYWLIIHVLLVVGSYGAFVLSGIIGHLYLVARVIKKQETKNIQFLSKCILQAMYIGVAMLIPGTILGGVWAAESWGRFWDWDPKESWAFISSCVYLIWIHAYTFQYIKNFGLAVGSIIGLGIITFTWYGVNYILGTGLHSYGFGFGGELYYYGFLICELIFLFITWRKIQSRNEIKKLKA